MIRFPRPSALVICLPLGEMSSALGSPSGLGHIREGAPPQAVGENAGGNAAITTGPQAPYSAQGGPPQSGGRVLQSVSFADSSLPEGAIPQYGTLALKFTSLPPGEAVTEGADEGPPGGRVFAF